MPIGSCCENAGRMSAQPSARPQESSGAPATPSGRLLLRMPGELHAELARAAEREGTSLNGFITRSLARAVGWEGGGRSTGPASPPGPRRDPLAVLLVVNAAAVALAALAAVAILLLAWLG